jgi:hypothetical protein
MANTSNTSSSTTRPDLNLAPSANVNYETGKMIDVYGVEIDIPKPLPKVIRGLNISLLVDRSGSMTNLYTQTYNSLRDFIKKQTAIKVPGEGRVTASLWSFDNKIEIPWSDVSISDVYINPHDFYPRGMTALLDCIGTHLSMNLSQYDSCKNPPKQCIVIMTDGDDNASTMYTREAVFSLITECKQRGWTFIFMGANQDAIKTGQYMGLNIDESLTFGANSQDTQESWSAACDSISRTRSGEDGAFTQTERSNSHTGSYEAPKAVDLFSQEYNEDQSEGLLRC